MAHSSWLMSKKGARPWASDSCRHLSATWKNTVRGLGGMGTESSLNHSFQKVRAYIYILVDFALADDGFHFTNIEKLRVSLISGSMKYLTHIFTSINLLLVQAPPTALYELFFDILDPHVPKTFFLRSEKPKLPHHVFRRRCQLKRPWLLEKTQFLTMSQ